MIWPARWGCSVAFPLAALATILPAASSFLGGILDLLSGDKRAQAEALMKQLDTEASALLGQIDINKTEAQHASIFVAGWRPAIGWICAGALAYQYIARPFLVWGMSVFSPATPPPPMLDSMLWELIMGMLGIGGLRTWEKIKGVAR